MSEERHRQDGARRRVSWRDWAAFVFLVLAVLGVAWVAWAVSFPGWNWVVLFPVPFSVLAFVLIWAVVTALALASDRPVPGLRLVAWMLTPVVAIAGFAAVAADVPLRIRLEMSRGSFEQVARDVVAGRRQPPPDGRLGFYEISMATRLENGFSFLVEGSGFIDPCGFAYSERGEPAVEAAVDLWHITGPWYGWCWDF